MFAIIQTGAKQYLVEPGQKLKVEKLVAEAGNDIVFKEVLFVADGKDFTVGEPLVKGASVTAKVLQQGRAKKVIVFHYRAKTRHHKKAGHRQPFTEVEITKITS